MALWQVLRVDEQAKINLTLPIIEGFVFQKPENLDVNMALVCSDFLNGKSIH